MPLMRPVLPRRVSLVLALVAGVCRRLRPHHHNTPRAPATPSTLEAARRVHYLIAASVSGDPTGMGPPGTTDQLRQWVGTYLAQVGLATGEQLPGPGDVELRLSLSAHGGSVLLYGTAVHGRGRERAGDRPVVDQRARRAGDVVRAHLARELVEAMVHSTRLATYADAASGGRAAARRAAVGRSR